MTKGEIAKELFCSGKNCSQSVLLAFKDEIKIDEENLSDLIIGFGGGFGRQRLVCGAVSGMVAVIGAVMGKSLDKSGVYALVQKACYEFKCEVGSINCGELLSGISADNLPIAEKRTEEYYKKRPCAELCKIAGNIVEKIINEKEL